MDSNLHRAELWQPPTDPASEEDTEDPITCDEWLRDVVPAPHRASGKPPVTTAVLIGFTAFFTVFVAAVLWLA